MSQGGIVRVIKNAMSMMFGTITSRLLGLFREMVVAALFGAGRELDAFWVAFTLPNLLRRLLAEGALSAAFVPVFTQVYDREGKESASRLASVVFFLLAVICSAITLFGIISAPLLVKALAPGFSVEDSALAVSLTRWMFPFLVLVSLSAIAMGVLNSLHSFFIPAVAPALLNVFEIAIALLMTGSMGIYSLVIGVLVGGAAGLFLQVYYCFEKQISLFNITHHMFDNNVLRVGKLFMPYALGLSLTHVNTLVDRILGSFLQAGTISVLNYSFRLLQLPQGLFAVAVSQAILPLLSSRESLSDRNVFLAMVSESMRFTALVIFPATIGLLATGDVITHLFYYRGAFSDWALQATQFTLLMYALGLPGMAFHTVATRAFYAKEDTRSTLIVTYLSVAVNTVGSIILMKPLAHGGLALATSISMTVAACYSLSRLQRLYGRLEGIFAPFIKIMAASLMMGAILRSIIYFAKSWAYVSEIREIILVCGCVIIGALSFLLFSVLLRCEELRWVKASLFNRKTYSK